MSEGSKKPTVSKMRPGGRAKSATGAKAAEAKAMQSALEAEVVGLRAVLQQCREELQLDDGEDLLQAIRTLLDYRSKLISVRTALGARKRESVDAAARRVAKELQACQESFEHQLVVAEAEGKDASESWQILRGRLGDSAATVANRRMTELKNLKEERNQIRRLLGAGAGTSVLQAVKNAVKRLRSLSSKAQTAEDTAKFALVRCINALGCRLYGSDVTKGVGNLCSILEQELLLLRAASGDRKQILQALSELHRVVWQVPGVYDPPGCAPPMIIAEIPADGGPPMQGRWNSDPATQGGERYIRAQVFDSWRSSLQDLHSAASVHHLTSRAVVVKVGKGWHVRLGPTCGSRSECEAVLKQIAQDVRASAHVTFPA